LYFVRDKKLSVLRFHAPLQRACETINSAGDSGPRLCLRVRI
jgi:hypothetical protein